jgi:ankyrin repeat protein
MRSIELTLLVLLGGIAAGCRPGCLDTDANRRVFDAAWNNDGAAMRDLLRRDASLATATGCVSLQSGARSMLAARMSGLTTPLLVAARQGHAEIVALLLAHGAPVDGADPSGDTPLHLAARYGHDEVVKVLIAAHASIDARSRGNLTPLDAAATNGRFVAVKLLLAAGADVNRREMEGYTALHSAAQGGDADVARLLLEHGAKIDGQTDRGVTPLQSAIVGRHNDVAALLAAKGADVNRGNQDTTPLLLALSMGDANAVGQLIRHGADVNAPSARGGTPLQAIIRERRRGDQFDDPIRVQDQEKMRLLLAAGANLRARSEDGNMPLHLAAMNDRDDLAELLIARGADVNARNTSEWTPLHFAAQRGHTVVVQVLLAHGADINAQGRDGLTPLNQVWGNDAMKNLLERHGGHRATVGR